MIFQHMAVIDGWIVSFVLGLGVYIVVFFRKSQSRYLMVVLRRDLRRLFLSS